MRLIDADRLQKQFNEKSTNPNYRVNMHNIKSIISNAPTIEAIPKADYEQRLKADLKAILVELQLEIEEKSFYDTHIIGNYEDEVRVDLVELDDVNNIIQQKINSLKESKNGKMD